MSESNLYYERLLAPLLGLSRDDLISLSTDVLKKNKALRRREGRDTVISQEGLQLITDRLRSCSNTPLDVDFSPALVAGAEIPPPAEPTVEPDPDESAAAPEKESPQSEVDEQIEQPPPPEKNNGLVELIVFKLYPNRKMLRATTPGGELVDVRVKTNVNFVPRMKLRARQVCPGKYEMEGRCPRTRGRY